MNIPRKLTDDRSLPALEASVLQEARRLGPTPEVRQRMLAGIASTVGIAPFAGAGAVSAGAGAVSESVHQPPAPPLPVAKGGLTITRSGVFKIGVSVGGLVLVGMALLTYPWQPSPDRAEALPTVGAPMADELEATASPNQFDTTDEAATTNEGDPLDDAIPLEDLPKKEPEFAAKPTLSAAKSLETAQQPGTPSIAAELAQLRKVRARLGASDAAGALVALDEYDRRFPQGQLRSEANVLRIGALVRSGQREQAARLAADHLQGNSPYSKRVRALLNEE